MAEIIITSSSLTSLQSSTNLSVSCNGPPGSTPVRHTQQTFTDYSMFPPLLAQELHLALDTEMWQAFIGPLSTGEFFNDFLPVDDVPPPSTSSGFMRMVQATSEKQMYRLFVCLFVPFVLLLLSYINHSGQCSKLALHTLHCLQYIQHSIQQSRSRVQARCCPLQEEKVTHVGHHFFPDNGNVC